MAPVWVTAFLAALLAVAGPPAGLRDAEVRREFTVGSRAVLGGPFPLTQVFLRAHTEVSLRRSAVVFRLTLDPGAILSAPPRYVRGLTEAYVGLRGSRSVFSIGIERIPLEVARLTLPFSIERVDVLGTRLGRPGARLLWYPDEATRLRFAALDIHGRLEPLVSIRRQFSSFEIEAHALRYRGRAVYGLGGSGLVGNLVVYGEIWALNPPRDWRYAVGISGSLGDGIWTLEGGNTSELPGAPARRQLAGQMAWRLNEDVSVTLTGRLFFDAAPYRSQVIVQAVKIAGNAEFTAYAGGAFGSGSPVALVGASLRISY